MPPAPPPSAAAPSDAELLALFADSPQRAWGLFLERHAGAMLAMLRGLGFDRDQAMDRFVYVCEKLSEDDFRRLRSVRRLGQRSELTPWLRAVVRNLCVNWAWSLEGRRRLLKSIGRLSELDRRVFQLHFWNGRAPSEIFEHLRCTYRHDLSLLDVFESLERILSRLSRKKLWRLVTALARRQRPLSLDDPTLGDEPAPLRDRDTPEAMLLRRSRTPWPRCRRASACSSSSATRTR
jgi:DNA-directed RNA polymerase specialized sigma24 family protein